MENEKKLKKFKVWVVICMVVVIILLMVIGGLIIYIINNGLPNKDNQTAKLTNNATQDNSNEVNATGDTNTTDAYAKYPDFEWTRTTRVDWGNSYSSAYIDEAGIIRISTTDNIRRSYN